jgi:hypothetical protein
MKKQKGFVALFLVGVVANWTFMAPWHEFGHILAAYLAGGDGYLTSFNSASILPFSVFTVTAGPVWEIVTYPFAIYASVKWRKPLGWVAFFWGNLVSVYLLTPVSVDAYDVSRLSGLSHVAVGVIWLVATTPVVVILVRSLRGLPCRTYRAANLAMSGMSSTQGSPDRIRSGSASSK